MTRLLFFLVISAIVMGLSPVSHHMLSMQTMRMEEKMVSPTSNMEDGSGEENSTASCCDEIAPFSQSCSFLVSQYTCIDLAEGGKQVISLNPVVQHIYIEILTPPPKA